MHESIKEQYHVVIGLEIHIQLLTDSKMFSSDRAEYGALPNTNLSPITLACPGALPRVNKKAFDYAIKLGLACGATITDLNFFARKSYFYPDLPKGFQITQDTTPICQGGFVTIYSNEGVAKQIPLIRMHLEEDTGKSLHGMVEDITLLDYNRAGTPLVELVTEPALTTGEEAYQFLAEIRKLVRYLDICDGNMEEASLRCDANISVARKGAQRLGTRVEVKNMNSMRNVQLAIAYEIDRQIDLLEAGEVVIAETRNFQATSGETVSLRAKETASEYRYFPEPDIPPIWVSQEWIEGIRKTMPLLPRAYFKKFTEVYGLSDYTASVLTENKAFAMWFDELCQHTTHYIAAANWLLGPVKGYLNELSLSLEDFPLTTDCFVALITLVESGTVSFSIAASQIFPLLLQKLDTTPMALAKKLDLIQDSDEGKLKTLVAEVLAAYPDKVAAYKNGKSGLLAMFMGEIMKKSQGKANAPLARKLLEEALA
ncbi:MAG: Asp-tRNA(Asn)/Glu-tRNA(Gln) amidotransferase subunit GatB [Candidatus Cardinium sp.]|uniref:Asp-tRNA(Asn)/Glu-tRNA(Gln) amidotransferase subunit GatB n=1 Tax=Candidatus Cardinium sp. TP TaxID=2961955 RepID=UPI0021AE4F69|nr:Asp-tRNA(Asn)/Glu-tRNA(Gln) amidotransferase subunit GatB [Candidatus Cardinium sp. TP]MCT4696847.1 Asp-tRNA(Asn)/Glu-tRNA(Gln) amidotransferase subunit GatB [Candidatus Cardinium sp. TP]MDN5246672.1 Asp-tRNA(Asn)/Glu-tRNA(Gln) amidotransferase subunit GatB [Candidatus Cardinium sp.]